VFSDGVAKDREEFRVIASGGLIALQNHRTQPAPETFVSILFVVCTALET
jgi:hypothetical protein